MKKPVNFFNAVCIAITWVRCWDFKNLSIKLAIGLGVGVKSQLWRATSTHPPKSEIVSNTLMGMRMAESAG